MIQALQKHLALTMNQMTVKKLFRTAPRLEFTAEVNVQCCGRDLKVLKTSKRHVFTLTAGKVLCHETHLSCSVCHKTYEPEALAQLVPDGARYGFDVIVFVGQAQFVECKKQEQIQVELAHKGISISLREI
mgnify:CR=1 FL=1